MEQNVDFQAFEFMPYGILVFKVKEDVLHSVEAVYCNRAMEQLFEITCCNIGDINFNTIFKSQYEEFGQMLYKAAYKKVKSSISRYDTKINRYIKMDCYHYMDGYCVCMLTDESQAFTRKNILEAISNSFYVIAFCNIKKERLYITDQSRGKEHTLNTPLKYSEYVNSIIKKIVDKEYIDEMRVFMSKYNVRQKLSEKKPVISFEYKRYLVEEDKFLWSRMSFIWVSGDDDGFVQECILTVQDIHEEKVVKLREKYALIAAYDASKMANETKSTFLRHMSQNLRTPINYIIGMTTIAENNFYNQDRVTECMDKIRKSSTELLENINEIMYASRLENGNITIFKENINILELIQETKREMQEDIDAKGHAVYISYKGLVHADIVSDRLRLKQIFVNVLSNAIKYTPQNGNITFNIEELSGADNNKSNFKFIITDNGIGIDKEKQKDIFVPFKSTQDICSGKAGMGLGLPIVQNIVHILDGNISVESEPGHGSSFVISIPLKIIPMDTKESIQTYFGYRTLEKHADREMKLRKFRLEGKRVILADDNGGQLKAIAQMLKNVGIYVDEVDNGRDAVSLVENHEESYYDMILMDVQMPTMNGHLAAKAIRALKRKDVLQIPIIAMSNNVYAEDIILSNNAGMNDHISKPIEEETLIKLLKKWMK